MKNILVFFVAMLFVIPANAVVIRCVSEGSGVVRVDYDASDETVLPRAFGMDITVDGGAVISKLYDYKVGDSNSTSRGFGIFPASMTFDSTGLIKNWGTPEVNSTILSTALGGVGTPGVTIGMASRYALQTDAPGINGTLFRILVDTRGAASVNVKAVLNTASGGIVLVNATAAKFSSVGCTIGSLSVPSAPASVNYPTSNNTGQYTVSWPSSSGATSYQLERTVNNGSTWVQIYSGSTLAFSDTVSNGNYLYRVRATNNIGLSSWTTGTAACVVVISATPNVPLAPGSISYPATNNTGQYPVSWSSSNTATSYQLERSANNGGTWTQIYSGSALTFSDTVSNGNYRYRIRATNSVGSSNWTTGSWNCVVTIPTLPGVPLPPASISYPANSITGKYTVSWAASTGATSYQLDRSANNGSTWTRIYSGSAISFAQTLPSGSYLYHVRATNSIGSSGWTIGTGNCVVSGPSAPASISYPASSITGKYTVSWAASTGATSYQLERSANNGSTWIRIYSGSAVSFAQTLTSGSYRYRVRATNSIGSSGWITGTGNCVVSGPSAPASVNYPASSYTGQYTVSWSSSNTATSYQLDRSANNGSTWTRIYSGSAISFAQTLTNGSYRYRVRATNAVGSSGWTTGTGNCVVLIVTLPATPSSISYPRSSNTGKYTVSWPSSSRATSYQLERSVYGSATWVRVYSGSALSWSDDITNGRYYYRVRAANIRGVSSWRTGSYYCEVSTEHEDEHEDEHVDD